LPDVVRAGGRGDAKMKVKEYTQEQLIANLELLIERFKLYNKKWLDNDTYIFNAAIPMLHETIRRLGK